MKILPVLFAASLLATSVTTFANNQTDPRNSVDEGLRALLGVHCLYGECRFSKQDEQNRSYEITLLEFKDGKRIMPGSTAAQPIKILENGKLVAEALWRKIDGKTKAIIHVQAHDWIVNVADNANAFLDEISSIKDYSDSNDRRTNGVPDPEKYQDYYILADECSSAPAQGEIAHQMTGKESFATIVKNKKYVVALAVKTFLTKNGQPVEVPSK